VCGINKIVIETGDTDVLLLAMAYCKSITDNGTTNVFVDFAVGKHKKWFDITKLVETIGERNVQGLPFFHSFSGCDNTSSFYNHGKCKFWDAWLHNENSESLTEIFIQLSNMPSEITSEQIEVISKYLCNVYYPKEKDNRPSLAELRMKHFFKSPDPKLKNLILSKEALVEHIKRAAFQAGWLWKESQQNPVYPEVTEWGWQLIENKRYLPKWCQTFTPLLPIIETCSCQEKSKCSKCKCTKSERSCIRYCNCQRSCES
jgi:hypothetical protein